MTRIRQDELESVLEAVGEGTQTVHISGQPGVGKSTFIEGLDEELSELYETRTLYVREGYSPTTLTQDILHEVRDAAGAISSFLNRMTGASLGVASVSGGVSVDGRARHIQKFAKISQSVPARKQVVLFIDDVHKLDEPEVTRDFLREVMDNLGENVYLISAGRLRFEDAEYTLDLDTFSREQTEQYLQREFPDIDPGTVDSVYETLEGHPYYLGLLTEAAGPDSTLRLPKKDARDFIERAYLDSMSEEEENFIRETSGLGELDADICSSVLEDVNRTQVRRILDSLSTKAVVKGLGRSDDTGDRVFKVHDLFQEFLHEQLNNPDELHRRAFQYYAGKLYNAVEESEAPSLEGFGYGLLGNAHLQEIYGEEPEVEDIRAEVDELGLEPAERLQYILGYAPYAPSSSEDSAVLMALEWDSYADWLRSLEPEDEEEELQIDVYTVLVDLFRATHRSTSNVEFEESSVEIYDSTIQRIEDEDFTSVFDEEDQDAAQIIPDMMLVLAHAAAHRDVEDEEVKLRHLDSLYDVLEKYGLDRVAVEGFIDNCRELVEENEPGEQAEEMIENEMEGFFSQFDEDDMTRNTLMQMQTDLLGELMELANSAFSAAISESDRLLEFIHDCGDSLAEAENPFFVALWYSIAAKAYAMFAPEAESTKELKETYQHYAELREEYEEELENPIYEIDEFEVDEFDFPDLVNGIADSDDERRLME